LNFFCDAIKNVIGGTVSDKLFPPTTLIRLYKLLKNSRRVYTLYWLNTNIKTPRLESQAL